MRLLLYRVRRLRLWVWLVSSIGAPLYALLWEYIINLRGKILYLRSGYRTSRDGELDRTGLRLLREPAFVAFAQYLRSRIAPQMLHHERERLLATEDEYSGDLFDVLDGESRAALLRFAVSEPVLRHVMPYLRVAPRIRRPNLMFNVVRGELGEEGSKLWHRDSFTYRCVTLFMCVTEVDDQSGPYFAIGKDRVPFHAEVPKAHIDPSVSVWKRYRLGDDEMFAYVDPRDVVKLAGEAGTTVMVDSGACYHKGGYCKTRERLMLQIRYVTDDGDAALPGWAGVVDLRRQDVVESLNDPLNRYMISPGDSSLVRRLGLFRVCKTTYLRILRYHATARERATDVVRTPGSPAPV